MIGAPTHLDDRRLLARTAWGGWLVVPSFNLDVAVGVVRDGVIEPWTTELVRGILKPGHRYLNAGANFGYYVALGGMLVGGSGRVFAVEPNPHILPYLLQTLHYSGTVGCVTVSNRALSDVGDRRIAFSFDPQYLGGGGAHEIWSHSADLDTKVEKRSLEEALWSADNVGELFSADGVWRVGTGLFVRFSALTQTIDAICAGEPLDLLHLDIEGSEPLALAGAVETIRRSPDVRLITEWAGSHFQYGSERMRTCFKAFWELAQSLGLGVRRVVPSDDGRVHLSQTLDLETLTGRAIHGDYFWCKGDASALPPNVVLIDEV